ncbi:hypothetical protein ccbrp13_16420 [Ktedonobacteria bacterium brp13]|nr:hypothetical protein ccbrp13_16420 [Ktedonobacteria bacterium brp13]
MHDAEIQQAVTRIREQLTGAFIFGHFHEEHEPDMRAWLDKVKKEG